MGYQGHRTWTDESLELAVKANTTLAGILRDLNLTSNPGNYKTLHRHIKRLKLDTTHFKGVAHGYRPKNKRSLSDILVKDSTYSNTVNLKRRLFKEGLLIEVCSECGLEPLWNGQPLVLQLDHINGVSTDNRLENLRILCPNCHTQTDTFTNKRRSPINLCACGTQISKSATRCQLCQGKYRRGTRTKITWPEPEVLSERVLRSSYTQVAKELGVSGTSIRAFLKLRLGEAPRKHRGASGSRTHEYQFCRPAP